jgi:hypothetical protein
MSKKIIALVAPIMLFFGPIIHAAAVKSCDKDGLACEKSAFDFGLTALYLQAYSGSLSRNSTSDFKNAGTSNNNRSNVSGNAPWDWGGIVEGRYHFSGQNDVNLSWMSYSLDYHATDISHGITNFGAGPRTSNGINVSSGRINLNSVNGEFAQSFDLSSRSTVRLFAGGQYLNIKNKARRSSIDVFEADTGPETTLGGSVSNNKSQGIGPRIGLDANYKLKGNFSVFANSAATILLARRTLSSSGFSANSTFHSTRRSDIAIPELEAKLGLTYNQPLAHGMASISAGWSVINYFSLLDADRNDLTLSGPFLQGRWVG